MIKVNFVDLIEDIMKEDSRDEFEKNEDDISVNRDL